MLNLSIRTPRLTLRPFAPADAPRVRELAGAWDVAKMVGSIPHPYPKGAAETWIGMHPRRRATCAGYPFAATLHNRVIGAFGLEAATDGDYELGYWLGVAFWGQGYATEAARAVLDFGFEWLGIERAVAGYIIDNPASARVLWKLGFVETGQGMRRCNARRRQVACVELQLTRDAWAATRV